MTPCYDPCPAKVVANSTWKDKTLLLGQLMLLADSGFHFHLSRLINSPEKYQYLQVLFILDLDPDLFDGGGDNPIFRTLPKLLGLPNFVDINEFVAALHTPYRGVRTLLFFFEDFQQDPVRSGGFYHDPTTWHAFAATRFLRFLATASSQ